MHLFKSACAGSNGLVEAAGLDTRCLHVASVASNEAAELNTCRFRATSAAAWKSCFLSKRCKRGVSEPITAEGDTSASGGHVSIRASVMAGEQLQNQVALCKAKDVPFWQ